MSFAEIVLRLGVTFVAWLVIYMHLIMLLVLRFAQCPEVSAWRVTLVSGAFAFGGALALTYGHGVRGAAAAFRNFALPLIVILPWATWVCLPFLSGTTFGGNALCAVLQDTGTSTASQPWQKVWAPAQLVVLAIIAVSAWRAWTEKPQSLR